MQHPTTSAIPRTKPKSAPASTLSAIDPGMAKAIMNTYVAQKRLSTSPGAVVDQRSSTASSDCKGRDRGRVAKKSKRACASENLQPGQPDAQRKGATPLYLLQGRNTRHA